jgi:hypothetical protein
MGDLKPIGSEKLTGQAKLARIMEIARYGETPKSEINETSTKEYSRTLADGYTYAIVKEKSGYIIKKGINESELDYIEPMKNRKYHKSYSQAMKKINLVAGELNRLHENNEGLSLFGEDKKFVLKTPEPAVEPTPDVEPMDTETTTDLDVDLTSDETPMGGEMDLDITADDEAEGDIDTDVNLDLGGDEMPSADDEEMSFKSIEKLTGKLGQKLRKMDQAEGLSSDNMKYVINSILSALDLNNLDEEDREDILTYFDEDEDSIDYGVDDESNLDVEVGDELDLDIDSEVNLDPETQEVEMKEDDMYLGIGDHGFYDKSDRQIKDFDFDYDEEEYDDFDDFISKYPNQNWFRKGRSDDAEFGRDSSDRKFWDRYKEKFGGPFKLRKRRSEMGEGDDMYLGIGDHGFYDQSDNRMKDFDFDYDEEEYDDYDEFTSKYPKQRWFQTDGGDVEPGRKFWNMYKEKFGAPYKLRKRRPMGGNNTNELYSESKIDRLLSKYFKETESEKRLNENKKVQSFLRNKIKTVSVKNMIKEFAETVEQELASEFLIKESDNLKFIGKTNLKNLVFVADGKEVKITRTGEIL